MKGRWWRGGKKVDGESRKRRNKWTKRVIESRLGKRSGWMIRGEEGSGLMNKVGRREEGL